VIVFVIVVMVVTVVISVAIVVIIDNVDDVVISIVIVVTFVAVPFLKTNMLLGFFAGIFFWGGGIRLLSRCIILFGLYHIFRR